MQKLAQWWVTATSVAFALRMIAFERCDLAAAVTLAVIAVPAVAVTLFYDTVWAAAIAAAAAVLYLPWRKIVCAKRCAMIRRFDTIEYALVEASDDYRQRFETGVVLQRLLPAEAAASKLYDPQLMDEERCFFLTESQSGTRLVALAWITGIEPAFLPGEDG